MNHAGQENGNLKATYDQLVKYGLSRSKISEAIEEAEYLGLLKCQRGGRWADTNQPSTYRLTYLPSRDIKPPTNEWKRKTAEQIKNWKRERNSRKRAKADYRRKNRSSVTEVALP